MKVPKILFLILGNGECRNSKSPCPLVGYSNGKSSKDTFEIFAFMFRIVTPFKIMGFSTSPIFADYFSKIPVDGISVHHFHHITDRCILYMYDF